MARREFSSVVSPVRGGMPATVSVAAIGSHAVPMGLRLWGHASFYSHVAPSGAGGGGETTPPRCDADRARVLAGIPVSESRSGLGPTRAPGSPSAPSSVFKPALLLLASLFTLVSCAMAAEVVGKRPYELDWANRNQDEHPPLVDFEDLTGWRVECRNSEAKFERTREEQIWGQHVGKLTYRGTGSGPEVRVLAPTPVAISDPFDAVTLWCHGNNWGWATDPSTPRVGLTALFEDASGGELSVHLGTVDWKEWFLLHKRLAPEQIERLKAGAKFKGFLVTGGKNKDDRVLCFDNLAVFVEQFGALTFAPRPERGIPMFPGQSMGANTGPQKLPFPNRDRTILPVNLTDHFTNTTNVAVNGAADGFVFTYEGDDGRLIYRLKPQTGTWSDIVAEWQPGVGAGAPPGGTRVSQVQPCLDGGVYLQTPAGPVPAEKAEHLGTRQTGGDVESRWRLGAGGVSAEVTFVYHLWNKSLVIDVHAPGGRVAEVRFGRVAGVSGLNPRLVTNPFYPAEGGRPAVVVCGSADSPLFITGNADWYLSNGSILWAANAVSTNGVTYHGGTRYVPLTNGKRNDCFERFFVTISPRYEEVLPSLPNPASPWKHVTGTRLWRAHGASNREEDARYWTEVHRYGITQMVVTDHETLWRDEGESFTFRTKAAPGKGGDKGAYDYARLMQDKLGFVYGPYNNYTDFAPVNEFWSADLIGRDPQNQLQRAWMRCYAPKPARAIEYCARLAPQIQEKFKFSTAYCDVHTAVAPWHRVDYDPRVPGAGTFAAVFYSYGEIMLHQKKAWNGPVYSEGNFHCFYMGLTDGNYGQDQSYRPAENPWLVDFDLRKMHDLGCNFGMGNMDMFYASAPQPRGTTAERDAEVDRFLAATVAFGHPGFLVMEGGMGNALRSYYMLQQLHSRYCLTNAVEIRYATAEGQLIDTSRAVAGGAYQRSQVVTRYADGTVTAANGSRKERLRCEAFGRKLDLPPNGYSGWTADGAVEVLSSDLHGRRSDYAVTPAYLYVDGRGEFVRFGKVAGNGIGVCRILPNGKYEVILVNDAECGFAISADSAVALDKDNKELGPARLRSARGLTYVLPVKGAFSYLLRASVPPATQGSPSALASDRDRVVPGERVVIRRGQAHEIQIPTDAKSGQRLWFEFEGAWIDFTVVSLADLDLEVTPTTLRVTLTSHLEKEEEIALEVGARTQRLRLTPNLASVTTIDLPAPSQESAEVLPIVLRAGAMSQRLEVGLRTSRGMVTLVPLPAKWTGGMALRGRPETSDVGTSAAVVRPQLIECGEVGKQGLFMHPPWQTGTGYSFALYDPVVLPAAPPAAFRASVGKGNGSDLGDGILYKVAVLDAVGNETVVAQATVLTHEWKPIEADLSRWAGTSVRLKLVADAGAKDDPSGDWAGWGDMRIESLRAVLQTHREEQIERIRHEAGPHPVGDLTLAALRAAKSGRLHYEGKGLEGAGAYRTVAVLNGIELGDMTPASGSETESKFSPSVSVPLSLAALRSLDRRNVFVVKNPNRDCFSIRGFWIELELEDGRACSSDLTTATFTQPPEWKYAEGMGVPADQEISVEIWFVARP